MTAGDFFLDLVLILVAARVCGELALRLGAPSVIGELLAGVLLGPSVFGLLETTEIIHLLAEIGVILLLFEVGLETDFSRLTNAGKQAAIVAMGGLLMPFTACFLLARYGFGQSSMISLFIGGTLTATSIGVTLRILRDVGRQSSAEGQIVLGAAVIDDVIAVLLLALLHDFARSGDLGLLHLGKLTLFIGLFFVLAPVVARALSALLTIYQRNTTLPGLVATSIVSLVLLFAWLARYVGAPELLGGFVTGLALSRRFFLPFGVALGRDEHFREEVHMEMRPIVQLFTPIFFVTVGLSLDLRAVDWSSTFIWAFSISLTLVAIVTKIAGGWMLTRHDWKMKTAIGMAMVPRGEVGLIFAELGRSSDVFDASIYAGMVLIIAYTTLLSPFWIKLFYQRYGHTMAAETEPTRLSGNAHNKRE